MDNTINGRTPEEIKKGLECCYGDKEKRLCDKCPNSVMVEGYSWPMCLNFDSVGEDALAYIQQLERERDAAVKDIGRCCATCIHYNPKCGECTTNGCFQISGVNSKWKWRGVPQEDKL